MINENNEIFFTSFFSVNLFAANYGTLDIESRFLRDSTNEMTLEDVQSSTKWEVITNRRLGYKNEIVWLHIKVLSKIDQDQKNYYLQYPFAAVDKVTAYEMQELQIKNIYDYGISIENSFREVSNDYLTIPLNFIFQQSYEFYIKIDHFGSVPIMINLFSQDEFTKKSVNSNFLSGFIYGVLIIVILYNLFLYLFTRIRGSVRNFVST